MSNINIQLNDLSANYKSIKSEIDSAIKDVLSSSSFIMGKHVQKFDENWANYIDTKFAFGVSNGTEAVRLALKAIGITSGDEVITVPNTFIATTESITDNGGKVVFVDVNNDNYNLDTNKLEEKITSRSKAIICVHLYGHPCDMDPILKIAKKYHLSVIEDCAQAHGAKYKGKNVGSIGDIGCWSMFPAKILGAYGDAGAITTNNSRIANKIKLLRDHGRISKYKSVIEGYNSRIDALQAAILNVKIKHIDKWIELRRRIAHKYSKELKNVIVPVEEPWAFHPFYMYVIRHSRRNMLAKYLFECGINTGIHYPIPLHLQPAYKYLQLNKGTFPVSESLSKKILSIPIYPELQQDQMEYIISKINDF